MASVLGSLSLLFLYYPVLWGLTETLKFSLFLTPYDVA